MIEIEVREDLIYIHGHAGAAPRGFSVPCEAVTVLCNVLAGSMHEITKQPEKIMIFEPGKVLFNRKGLNAESELLVKSFLLGLEMVSDAYSKYITMNVTKL